jgi:hypothetical protein
LQGLLVCDDNRLLRVYVVTVEPEIEDAIHLRWPRVMRLEAETPPL